VFAGATHINLPVLRRNGNLPVRLLTTGKLMSIAAHGLTAMPGIAVYGRSIAALDPSAPEHQEIKTTPAGS